MAKGWKRNLRGRRRRKREREEVRRERNSWEIKLGGEENYTFEGPSHNKSCGKRETLSKVVRERRKEKMCKR